MFAACFKYLSVVMRWTILGVTPVLKGSEAAAAAVNPQVLNIGLFFLLGGGPAWRVYSVCVGRLP